MTLNVFNSQQALVQALSDQLQKLSVNGLPKHIALSGGSTPKSWFEYLAASNYRDTIAWQNLHFWWVDERFVPHNHPESNYGNSVELLWRKIALPESNLHPVLTAGSAEQEVIRYQALVHDEVMSRAGGSGFDWIVLGVGEDGHTASLFPGQTDYSEPGSVIVCTHPDSGQTRISLSAKAIEGGKRVSYVVTGESKAHILQKTGPNSVPDHSLPASVIRSSVGATDWFVDVAATKYLDEEGS